MSPNPTPKPFFGPERPPTGPASRPNNEIEGRAVTTFKLGGNDNSQTDVPTLDTKGMSCIDFQVATEIPDTEIEVEILSIIQEAGDADEASWRAANPKIECPSEEEISKQMRPHITGKTDSFFYSTFQTESLTLAFKSKNFPTHTHFTEVWKDRSWVRKHEAAPYQHLFAVRASKVFARRAEGKVVVILPPGNAAEKTWHLTSLWNVELAILMANPKVTSIWRVDVDGNGSEMKTVS